MPIEAPDNVTRNVRISPNRFAFRVVLLALIAVALGILIQAILSRQPHRVGTGSNTLKVLFIGNSYIYVNNMPGLLVALSAHEATPVDAEMVVEGGATLAMHWQEGKALTAIQRTQWDYVVLQEQSTFGSNQIINGVNQIGSPASFRQAVLLFDNAIRKAGAKTVLYMTWARQNAPQLQNQIQHAYSSIANEVHALVAPVGLAWQTVLSQKPSIGLYNADGSHPDPAGSYLAACVFYATLYQKTPLGLPGNISKTLVDNSGTPQSGEVNLSTADAALLQQAAWHVTRHQ